MRPRWPYKRERADGTVAVNDYIVAATGSATAFAEIFLRRSRDRVKSRGARLPHRVRVAIARRLYPRSGRRRDTNADTWSVPRRARRLRS